MGGIGSMLQQNYMQYIYVITVNRHIFKKHTHPAKQIHTRTDDPYTCMYSGRPETVLSIESQKGVIAFQRCSVENQKGAFPIDFVQR